MSTSEDFAIPLMVPNLCGNEAAYLLECIESNQVSTVGSFVPRLENRIQQLTGSENVICTNSGTSALHSILAALEVGIDDLVIVQDYTFIATANAVSMTGASVWILGIDASTRSLDPQILQEALQEQTIRVNDKIFHANSGKRVRAVIQTFTDGHPGYVNQLHSICKDFSLPLVIDGAGALGAEYGNQKLGNLGDAQVISFNGNKTFTAGSGGAALITDKKLADATRVLCSVGRNSKDYQFDRLGYNYRMANINAAVCLGQLENFDLFLQKKREILYRYKHELSEFQVRFLDEDSSTRSSCWTSNLLVEIDQENIIRDILRMLTEKSIQARVFWKPIHLQPPYKNSLVGTTRVADKIWDKIISLPSSTSLTELDQIDVVETIKTILGKA